MPWNAGIFTRLYNWYQEYQAGYDIDPQKMDGEDDNFTTGINNCLTKDGQNAPDQDLPMAGKKHTNVGPAINRNEYLQVGQYQDGWGVYAGDSTGDADDYILSLDPSITAYVEGMRVLFKCHIDCNAGAEINISTVGTRPLVVSNVAVEEGDLKTDVIYVIIYTGTAWEILSSYKYTPPDAVVGCVLEAVATTDDVTLTLVGGPQPLLFTTEIYDTDDFHDPVDRSKVTIPTDLGGVYAYTARGIFDGQGGASGDLWFYLTKNGAHTTAIDIVSSIYIGTGVRSMGVSGIITLNAGDYLQIVGDSNATGGDVDLGTVLGTRATLSVTRLGAIPTP